MTASFVPRRNDSGRSLDPIPQDASEKARTAATTLRASMGDPPALNLSEARGSQRIAKATGLRSQPTTSAFTVRRCVDRRRVDSFARRSLRFAVRQTAAAPLLGSLGTADA